MWWVPVGWQRLGGGTYAVATGFSRNASETAALVELVGDPVEVVPSEDVESERSGEEVTVTENAGIDPGFGSAVGLVLTRTDAAEERLLPEEVMRGRNRGLRNTLAFVEAGVERVVFRTDESDAKRALGFGDGPRRFEFEGEAYEARIERPSP